VNFEKFLSEEEDTEEKPPNGEPFMWGDLSALERTFDASHYRSRLGGNRSRWHFGMLRRPRRPCAWLDRDSAG
jgi:hypothetical protein